MALMDCLTQTAVQQASLGDIGVLLIFGWVVGACIYGTVQVLRDRDGIKIEATKVTKGLAAIAVWLAFYFFLHWVKSVGFIVYLAYAIPVALALSVLSKISPKFRATFPNIVGQVCETLEKNSGWIVGFWFVLLYGGVLYWFLFAPYGVLCIIHLRPCGSW